jgi:hypothetical protein
MALRMPRGDAIHPTLGFATLKRSAVLANFDPTGLRKNATDAFLLVKL